jgi:hypothetical protein
MFDPDLKEEIQVDLPAEKGPKARMIVCVNADHEHDQVIIRCIMGILVMLTNTHIRWIPKLQKTVETSNLGK